MKLFNMKRKKQEPQPGLEEKVWETRGTYWEHVLSKDVLAQCNAGFNFGVEDIQTRYDNQVFVQFDDRSSLEISYSDPGSIRGYKDIDCRNFQIRYRDRNRKPIAEYYDGVRDPSKKDTEMKTIGISAREGGIDSLIQKLRNTLYVVRTAQEKELFIDQKMRESKDCLRLACNGYYQLNMVRLPVELILQRLADLPGTTLKMYPMPEK
ncbi:MAG: hypothetical protein V1743_05575 [Nanoarchaeota archaeon]